MLDFTFSGQARNKIIITHQEPENLTFTDVGYELSSCIQNDYSSKNISHIALQKLDSILKDHTFKMADDLSYIAVKNLGILFEQDLNFDFNKIIDKHSQNNILFIKWEGQIENGCLYYLTSANGTKINLHNLSFTTI